MSKVHKLTFMQEMVDLIDEINPPAIEIHDKKFVRVVPCKDCRNFHEVDEAGFGRCYEHDSYDKDGDYWYMDDFCSYGERKEDEID